MGWGWGCEWGDMALGEHPSGLHVGVHRFSPIEYYREKMKEGVGESGSSDYHPSPAISWGDDLASWSLHL